MHILIERSDNFQVGADISSNLKSFEQWALHVKDFYYPFSALRRDRESGRENVFYGVTEMTSQMMSQNQEWPSH